MNLTEEKTGGLEKYEKAIFSLIATVLLILAGFLLVKLASAMFGLPVDAGMLIIGVAGTSMLAIFLTLVLGEGVLK